MTGVNLQHVPYRGDGPAMADLIAGQVPVAFATTIASIEHIRAGQLRPLAVTTLKRSDVLPDLPSISEFVPGYETSSWFGIAAPAGTPADIIEILNRETNAGLADPDDQGAARRHGLHGADGLGGRLRQAHRRRNGKVGQSHSRRRHQGGVSLARGQTSVRDWKGHYEIAPSRISASRSGRRRASVRDAVRLRASLSVAAGAPAGRLWRRRRARHFGAPDGAMAVRSARPAVRRREQGRRQQRHRHRGGGPGACRRADAAAGVACQRRQCDALRQAELQFPPRHRAGRRHQPRSQRHGRGAVVSGQNGPGIHRLCQGQSGQDQHGVARRRHVAAYGRRIVQVHDRRRHGACRLSWLATGIDRPAGRTGAGLFRADFRRRSGISGTAGCGRWR